MRKRLVYPVAIIGLLIPAGLMLTVAPPPRVRAYDPPPVERYLYGAYPFSGSAKLILANSTMGEVTIEGKLYSPAGQIAPLQDVVLPAHAQKVVDLDGQIANAGPDFRSGGIELEFYSADPGIAAQLHLREGAGEQPIDIPLKAAGAYRSSRLEGLWMVPAGDARLGLILHNRTAVAASATVAITRRDGSVLLSRAVTLDPHGSRQFQSPEIHQQAPGSVGGISIQHNGAPGAILAAGYIQSAARRLSASIPFVDPTTLFGSNIYGAGAQLGNTALAAENFTGQLLVRNLSAQAVPVTASLQCGETRASLGTGTLAPGEARRLTVPADAIACDTGAVGVEVTSPVKSSLLGRWLSVGASGLVVETAIHSVSPNANISGSDPWLVDEETASILYVQNVGNSVAEFVPVIQYARHGHAEPMDHLEQSYMVGQTFVKPGEVVAIDIRALRDQQTPDVHGRILPQDVNSGQIHWLRGSGPALVANVLTVSAARRTASTFAFFCCYCNPRHVELRIQPQNVGGEVGQTQQMQAYEDRTDCHTMTWPVPISASQVSWGSSNIFVASVDGSGQVYMGPFPGSATIVASKWVIESNPDPFIGDGDQCYLDDYCYGSPQCLTDEFERYASASVDVTAPPPPPPPSVSVDSADILADQVVVTLSHAGSSGNLAVTAQGPSVSKTIFSGTRSGGQHTFSFDRNNLPDGQYTSVSATWLNANGSRAVSFRVLGVYRHSQYNTPTESSCTGNAAAAYLVNSVSCAYQSGTLRSDFISQSWLNGSGITITSYYGYNTEQNAQWCINNNYLPADAPGRGFAFVSQILTSCQSLFLNNTTVARSPNDANLTCGDQVLLIGYGTNTVKTVTDTCPICTASQLDNYTTASACSPRAHTDLGNFKTIRVNR